MSRKLLGRLTRLWGSFRPSSLVKSPNPPSSKLTPVTTLPLHPQLLFLLHLHHPQASLYPESPPYHPSAGQLTASSSPPKPSCSNHHSQPTPRAYSGYSSHS